MRKLTGQQRMSNMMYDVRDDRFDELYEHHEHTVIYHHSGMSPRFADAVTIAWAILEQARKS